MQEEVATPDVKSCGVLVVKGEPWNSFLLMRHVDRWDLPKGHVDPGETEIETALRELEEETGLSEQEIELLPDFRYAINYPIRGRRKGELLTKQLVIFLANLQVDRPIVVTEHLGSIWHPWQPPHRIQERTIDPVLSAAEAYFQQRYPGAWPLLND